MDDGHPVRTGASKLQPRQDRGAGQMPPLVRQVTLGVVVLWLMLVASVGWWMSQRIASEWVNNLSDSAEYEVQATARVMDRLFTEMVSVANMVARQGEVIELASRYRTDPPGFAELTREQRAAQLTQDPLVRKVGNFMDALSSDLSYARIYMNNMSDNTVTASNWEQSDSIVGMIYTSRTYLMNALRDGKGHSFGIARLNRSPSYFVASRIDDANDVPQGSVTVKFDAPDIALYLTGRHIALIVNSQGRVTTTSSAPFMLRNVGALFPPGTMQPWDDGEDPGAPVDIRALTGEGKADQWLIDGTPYLIQRQPLANTQYQVLTLASLAPMEPMYGQHIVTAVLVATFGLALIALASHTAGQMVLRRQDERNAAMQTSALNADLSEALTDAKLKERQKVEVLGYIGHDLRAPLATISGYSALLLADVPEKQQNLLQTIQRSVKYQLDLIEELLEYAKGELQPLAVQPAATDLLHLLDDISEYAIALCSQQNNRFRYQTSERMPQQIVVDGKRLQQVLLNLLSNAAKFTHDGVVTLSVTATPQADTCVLRFAVSDTGIGIDQNRGADIFSAFQHVQATSGGSGLGLYIAQRIVSAMGGSLGVSSTSGQGTTFSFELSVPVTEASDAGWVAVEQREIEPVRKSLVSHAPSNASRPEQALDELASLALHGRLTDIEGWIEQHAQEPDHAAFVAQLRELLEQFDFAGVHALALHGRSSSSA